MCEPWRWLPSSRCHFLHTNLLMILACMRYCDRLTFLTSLPPTKPTSFTPATSTSTIKRGFSFPNKRHEPDGSHKSHSKSEMAQLRRSHGKIKPWEVPRRQAGLCRKGNSQTRRGPTLADLLVDGARYSFFACNVFSNGLECLNERASPSAST